MFLCRECILGYSPHTKFYCDLFFFLHKSAFSVLFVCGQSTCRCLMMSDREFEARAECGLPCKGVPETVAARTAQTHLRYFEELPAGRG